jgi:hypothetical protein
MADEITMTFQILLSNGNLRDTFSSPGGAVDQAAAKLARNVQTIGTSEVALELGDVTTPGWCVFQNLDDTNFVEIGNTGAMFLKLKPLEQCLVRIGSVAPFAVADTAAIELFYVIYED